MALARVLACPHEVQVEPDASQQLGTVARDEITPVVGITFVQDWHDVDFSPAAFELDVDAVGPGFYLRRVDQPPVRRAEPLSNPVEKRSFFHGRFVSAHIHRDVEVVDGQQRSPLRDRAGMQHLHQRKPGVRGDVITQSVRRVLICLRFSVATSRGRFTARSANPNRSSCVIFAVTTALLNSKMSDRGYHQCFQCDLRQL